MSQSISKPVLRSIGHDNIKQFLQTQHSEALKKEYRSGNYQDISEDTMYENILNSLINKDEIDNEHVDEFLLDNFRYGKMNHIFIFQITSSKLKSLNYENQIIRFINNLKYHSGEEITSFPHFNKIRQKLPKGKKRLLYTSVHKEGSNITSIEIILSKFIYDKDYRHCVQYIPVEIDVKNKLVFIRMKDWNNDSLGSFNISDEGQKIAKELENAFEINLMMKPDKVQNIITQLLRNLTEPILADSVDKVNNNISDDVNQSIKKWTQSIDSSISLTKKDYDMLNKHVLNYFYKYQFQKDYGHLKMKNIKDIFDINGYPTYVKFIDDAIGEARTRSNDVNSSLLDTSIYYDLKARLDESHRINLSTIQFMDPPDRKRLGVSFHTEKHNELRLVLFCQNSYKKEIYDYVLRKIRSYFKSQK
ncbi:hypothetical protein [Salibacterium lacus]|uniref:Uncharacterized protein n=1 Tax=Salibacterium lacus TaxID=1898109 RepID=A0ABW5SY80_9BACI